MQSFPDTSVMERSKDGTEPIRGGSIGFNLVLGRFEKRAASDTKPEFTAVMINAYTVFRNVFTMNQKASLVELQQAFVNDITLFAQYYSIYLSHTVSALAGRRKASVVIYFPNYQWVEKEILKQEHLREVTGTKQTLYTRYLQFLSKERNHDEIVLDYEHVRTYFMFVGNATYPHKEVAYKLRNLVSGNNSLYVSSDRIALVSHVPLDYHIQGRVRNVHLLKSYTGELLGSDQFKTVLDKDLRIPFNTTTHLTFGDPVLIKPWVTPKVRKALLEQAEKERWNTRSEEDIRARISKAADIPIAQFRKFDFV